MRPGNICVSVRDRSGGPGYARSDESGDTATAASFLINSSSSSTSWRKCARCARVAASGGRERKVVTTYGEYQSFGPILFPMRVMQTVDGQSVLDITVRESQPNNPVNITAPASLR